MNRKILAIGSHYDDIEIGCGGTLLNHKNNGDEIYLAILKSDEAKTGDPLIRAKEQEAAASILEATIIAFLDKAEIPYIVEQLDGIAPDVIYMPHSDDYHQDHLKAYQVGKATGRKMKIDVLSYLTPTSYNYYPNVFSEINLAKKIYLVCMFPSQMERRPDYLQTMMAQHKFFGALSGCEAAEGFVFHRMIMKF